jgi:hypothetical protein
MSDILLPHRPRFRDGVVLGRTDNTIDVSYRDGGCLIELAGSTGEQSAAFLTALQAGDLARDELRSRFHELGVDDILDQLDGLGLITDAVSPVPAGISGSQCYRRARRTYVSALEEASGRFPRQLSTVLADGSATRGQLIGYAIEYYHVVAFCPRVLAPMLAQADDFESMMMTRRFYQSEMNHDRMLLQSLAAVDIDPTVTQLQPLPSTFAMMASLGVLAAQFPLALKAVLFVLEEPQPEFNDAFQANCERLGLPAGFVNPIARHSDVNEGESHDDISRDLLARVEFVTEEEAIEVEKAVADMSEQLAAAGQEMLEWYGATDEVRLRDF